MAAPTQPEPAAANSRATAAYHSKAKLAEHSGPLVQAEGAKWRAYRALGRNVLTATIDYVGKTNGPDIGYTLKPSRTKMYCSVNPQHS